MSAQFTPENYSRRTETVGGYTVAITSYRLGSLYHAQAEIHLPGAGARLARAADGVQAAAEEKVLAEARRLIERRG